MRKLFATTKHFAKYSLKFTLYAMIIFSALEGTDQYFLRRPKKDKPMSQIIKDLDAKTTLSAKELEDKVSQCKQFIQREKLYEELPVSFVKKIDLEEELKKTEYSEQLIARLMAFDNFYQCSEEGLKPKIEKQRVRQKFLAPLLSEGQIEMTDEQSVEFLNLILQDFEAQVIQREIFLKILAEASIKRLQFIHSIQDLQKTSPLIKACKGCGDRRIEASYQYSMSNYWDCPQLDTPVISYDALLLLLNIRKTAREFSQGPLAEPALHKKVENTALLKKFKEKVLLTAEGDLFRGLKMSKAEELKPGFSFGLETFSVGKLEDFTKNDFSSLERAKKYSGEELKLLKETAAKIPKLN